MSPKHRALMLLVLFAAGCSVWRPLSGAGLARPLSEPLDEATVILRDSTWIELEHVAITPDSVIGIDHATSARLAVARSNVADVKAQTTDPFLTFVAGAGTGVIVLFLLAMTTTPRT
jgi:hypothetical protein